MGDSMKLVVNYDFFKSVNQINDSYSNFYLIKERSKKFLKIDLPIYTTLCIALGCNLPKTIGLLGAEYFTTIAFLNVNKLSRLRIQKKLEEHRCNLVALPYKLHNLGVETEYDLLLHSEINKRRINIALNEHHIPSLNIRKIIDVPTQDDNGDINNVSLVQEHLIGSKDYVLTLK